MNNPEFTKPVIRKNITQVIHTLSRREERDIKIVTYLSKVLQSLDDVSIIGVYEVLPDEPNICPWYTQLEESGYTLVFPLGREEQGFTSKDKVNRIDELEIELLVVPGRAFDKKGNRIGRGGGWYDQTIAHNIHSECKKVGICYAAQILDDVPVEPHDQKVDILVCEEGIMYFS
ncbi:hypothetical protein KC717_04670 [Candidatus Dojkabacteria bacterium]|uniref:5-formyltetrahydrofolate cyclo-ligase n=1 Tax=Candidatus Dojkabacteria bacterium TaxID=2099670 RepID=A0A955L8A5_9BACT|nr:hypothetical protein [Candidatus Dojkabacteria bacterium]